MPVSADPSGGVLIAVKAVPGASQDELAGVLGDRLKVRVSAPPEGGRANKAVCATIAAALGVRAPDVGVVSGHGSREKLVRAAGIGVEEARGKLGV